MHVPVAVVVNSLTLTHCHGLDQGHTSIADCCYRLICGSLIIARFSAVGMGVSLYAGRLICEYIRYILLLLVCYINILLICVIQSIYAPVRCFWGKDCDIITLKLLSH